MNSLHAVIQDWSGTWNLKGKEYIFMSHCAVIAVSPNYYPMDINSKSCLF